MIEREKRERDRPLWLQSWRQDGAARAINRPFSDNDNDDSGEAETEAAAKRRNNSNDGPLTESSRGGKKVIPGS